MLRTEEDAGGDLQDLISSTTESEFRFAGIALSLNLSSEF